MDVTTVVVGPAEEQDLAFGGIYVHSHRLEAQLSPGPSFDVDMQ
jgi:hypothetical protein